MSLFKWLFQTTDHDDQWPSWVAGAVTLTISAVALYQSVSWLKKKFIIAKSKNDINVLIKGRDKVDLNRQSIILPGPDRIRASVLADGDQYLLTLDPTVTTLYENFLKGMRLSNDGPCLGYRVSASAPFEWLSYGQILNQAHRFGAGLIQLGLQPGMSLLFPAVEFFAPTLRFLYPHECCHK